MRLPPLSAIIRLQFVCIAMAAVVAATFWAIGQQVNLQTVVLYSFLIGNLVSPSAQALHFVYAKRRFPLSLALFLLVILILLAPVYVVSTVVVWWFAPPSPQSLTHLIATGWKLPVFATFVFAFVSYLYNISRERLENRNLELQRMVDKGVAQLKQQNQELLRAREIQQSLLPKEIPQLAGFEVAGAWRPARTVSGDYYDVFKLNEKQLAICIADVAGKGVSAALLMANVQAAVHTLANDSESPAQMCTKVNRLLCENIALGKFVTFLYGVLDGEARTFHYCNAGHLAPVHLSSGAAKVLDGSGAVLGVFPGWKFEDASAELRPGDRLLLFTDGITEAMDGNEKEFGEDGLAALARVYASRSATEINRLVLEDVSKFCDACFQDDATLLVIAAK
jgi:phosphoserine phosphatase RsbU/P